MDWDLEEWLTRTGDHVIARRAEQTTALSHQEQLIYAVWALDTEVRNGGIAQYFLNRGIEAWHSLHMLPYTESLPSLWSYLGRVDAFVAISPDPFLQSSKRKSI